MSNTKQTWFISIEKQRQGPFSKDELRGMIVGGTVNQRTHVWKKGMQAWERLYKIEELNKIFVDVELENKSESNKVKNKWYYARKVPDGKPITFGPYNQEKLISLYGDGVIDSNTRLWTKGQEQWVCIDKISELIDVVVEGKKLYALNMPDGDVVPPTITIDDEIPDVITKYRKVTEQGPAVVPVEDTKDWNSIDQVSHDIEPVGGGLDDQDLFKDALQVGSNVGSLIDKSINQSVAPTTESLVKPVVEIIQVEGVSQNFYQAPGGKEPKKIEEKNPLEAVASAPILEPAAIPRQEPERGSATSVAQEPPIALEGEPNFAAEPIAAINESTFTSLQSVTIDVVSKTEGLSSFEQVAHAIEPSIPSSVLTPTQEPTQSLTPSFDLSQAFASTPEPTTASAPAPAPVVAAPQNPFLESAASPFGGAGTDVSTDPFAFFSNNGSIGDANAFEPQGLAGFITPINPLATDNPTFGASPFAAAESPSSLFGSEAFPMNSDVFGYSASTDLIQGIAPASGIDAPRNKEYIKNAFEAAKNSGWSFHNGTFINEEKVAPIRSVFAGLRIQYKERPDVLIRLDRVEVIMVRDFMLGDGYGLDKQFATLLAFINQEEKKILMN